MKSVRKELNVCIDRSCGGVADSGKAMCTSSVRLSSKLYRPLWFVLQRQLGWRVADAQSAFEFE
jgi:hypothetical protein